MRVELNCQVCEHYRNLDCNAIKRYVTVTEEIDRLKQTAKLPETTHYDF